MNKEYGKYAKSTDHCRSCGSKNLLEVLSLGDIYVTNFVNSEEEQGPKVPLELILCDPQKGCGLVQLRHTTNPELMWGEQYWYKSGINSMIRNDLRDIVEKSKLIVPLNYGDTVTDIGCNDGTMLEYYNVPGLNLVGFEPSKNVAKEAALKGINVINDFFNKEAYKSFIGDKKSKIITAISMFYDLDNPNSFVEDVSNCLDENGLFVIQQNYVATMLKNNAVDNICHEHLEYYSYNSLEKLLNRHGFETFDVELNEINGGSIRNYIKFKGSKISQKDEAKKRVESLLRFEDENKLNDIETYHNFASRIESTKKELNNFLNEEKSKGKKICALGASTRGNTTLQYFQLNPSIIDCIFDRNPDKEGKKAVGSLIPVTSPDNIHKYNPDYQLVLIWHIFKGIGEDEKKFSEKGGKFILPLPELKII
ncbi:class I SAM-dependent methyltransferase [Candidatus Pacearchaeota archaeon]|nr:class I SAM-dependent methyltransferase [Candidatus Pacearchaeota archaeon]